MNRSSLPLSLILAAFAALLIAVPAEAASTGTLSVTVAGVPKKSKKTRRTVTVRAISLASGLVSESSESKRANPTLKLAPGAYVVAVRTIDIPGIAAEGTSGVAVVKAGRKTRKKLRVKPLRKKKKAKKSALVSGKTNIWAPESEYAGLRVIGVDPRLAVKGLKEYPNGLEIDSVLINPLSQGCQNDQPKVRLVEVRRRGEIIDELEHFDDDLFDKSKGVEPGHLLKERELVKGSALVIDGKLTVNLRLVNVATGEVTAASAVTGDAGSATALIDTIESAGQLLMDSICGGKVDVTFTGSANYARDEGNSSTDKQDAVRANYSWTTTYKGVNLAADGTLNFSTASDVTGSWHTDGRYGVEGPGSYHCEAPVKSYNGDFAMLGVRRTGPIARFEIDPFMNVQGDYESTNCTGLPGPPYANFSMMGHVASNDAIVEFSVADLAAAGSLSFNVAPPAPLAADCSDVVGGYTAPCTQSQSWSGTVTVALAR